MCYDLEDIIDKNYVYQILQQKAEYRALQTSVNPHFLYNSLEAIREKMNENSHGDEGEMVLLLSRIFEYQIRGGSIVTFFPFGTTIHLNTTLIFPRISRSVKFPSKSFSLFWKIILFMACGREKIISFK